MMQTITVKPSKSADTRTAEKEITIDELEESTRLCKSEQEAIEVWNRMAGEE